MNSDTLKDDRWKTFIDSLDVGPEKVKRIELLTDAQKNHLLDNYIANNNKESAYHYVTLIKALKTNIKIVKKPKKKTTIETPKQVLSATEISLRTNDVSWVYDFLEAKGLDALLDYMKRAVKILINHHRGTFNKISKRKDYQIDLNSDNCENGNDQDEIENSFAQTNGSSSGSSSKKSSGFFCAKAWRGSQDDLYSDINTNGKISLQILDGIHQCVKCLRALSNNQRGLSMTFENPDAINMITFCLLHPSFTTKTQVMDLLAGICLIEHGHEAVLKAFNELALVSNETTRFEFLVYLFSTHENFPSNLYSIDFMISAIQLINILVHNTEDMHLRVFLQQEFCYLGLDDYLCKLHKRASGNLLRQIEAFLDNEVDINLLLKDSHAKEQLMLDYEKLEGELTNALSCMANMQAENASRVARLEDTINQLKYSHENQEKNMATLKTKLSEKEKLELDKMKSSSREKYLEDRISQLEKELQSKTTLSATLISAPNVNGSSVPMPPTLTSCNGGPPPPPPPPPPGSSNGPPAPPPPPAMGLPPPSSQPVPIRQPFQTKYKLPVLNWTVLRNNQLKNTIFVNVDDEKIIKELDLDDFEEKFKLNNNMIGSIANGDPTKAMNGQQNGIDDSGTNKKTMSSRKPEKRSLLDPNRHRCLGVLLKFLESEKYNIEKLWEEISQLELSADVADRILHQLPTSDESKLYLSYEFTDQKPIDELSDEDKLILHLCKIERLGPRLEVIMFMNSFEDSVKALEPRIGAVNLASVNLKKSEKFRKVLEIILAIGNYMNSCRRGVVYGFKLQSLDVLTDTRSIDKRWTLMHYVVDTIERKFPKLVNFYEELDGLSLACKVPMEILTGDVTALKTGMKQSENELIASGSKVPERLVQFVDFARPKVDSMLRLADQTILMYNQVVEWFGESQSKPSPEKFFSIILRFVENFKKAINENEKRRRAEVLRSVGNGSMNGSRGSEDFRLNGSQSSSTPRKSKDPNNDEKDNPIQELQRRLAADAKRRYKNRTRQINGDGLMDEILAGLSSEPLQAEIHPKRTRGFDP